MFRFLKTLFQGKEDVIDLKEKYSIENITLFVEKNITDILESSIDDLGMDYEELMNTKKRKEIFKKQLDLCGLGDIASKQFVKSWIMDLITQRYGVNQNNINYIINFDFPDTYDKFCCILTKYFHYYRYDGLKKLIEKYHLDRLRENNGNNGFEVNAEDIDEIFQREIEFLTFEDKLEIVVQRIYENTYGLSEIDEIRDQNIDGISLGVSGIPIDFEAKISNTNIKNNTNIKYPMSYDSIWLYFGGKEIHMKILSFRSQRELERVCKKLYKFNNQKQFTKSDGFIFNNMADFSRVVVFRPGFSESWAAFIRKFDFDREIEDSFSGENIEQVIDLLILILRGKQNICVTGQQGTGKTTTLFSLVKKLYTNMTIRIYESYFEAFLRFKMPNQNILTLRETDELNGTKALDALKKSNGKLTVISEAADDSSKAYVIKGSLSASEFVLWTDHSPTPEKLIASHRNALLNLGIFANEEKAEEQVMDVLQWNLHIEENDLTGERYIARITEFNNDEEQFKNVVEYDSENKKYYFTSKISHSKKDGIRKNLSENDRRKFDGLMKQIEGIEL